MNFLHPQFKVLFDLIFLISDLSLNYPMQKAIMAMYAFEFCLSSCMSFKKTIALLSYFQQLYFQSL